MPQLCSSFLVGNQSQNSLHKKVLTLMGILNFQMVDLKLQELSVEELGLIKTYILSLAVTWCSLLGPQQS